MSAFFSLFVPVGDDDVLADLRAVEKAVCPIDGGFDRLVFAQGRADAGRQTDLFVPREDDRADALADVVQRGLKPAVAHPRHDEQKFVAAVADQTVGGADALFDTLRERRQHKVAGAVSVHVVIYLEVVEVDHRDPGGQDGRAEFFFVKTAVVDPRHHVGIGLFVKVVDVREEFFLSGEVDQPLRVVPTQKFHHIGRAVRLEIVRDDLIDPATRKFEFQGVLFR